MLERSHLATRARGTTPPSIGFDEIGRSNKVNFTTVMRLPIAYGLNGSQLLFFHSRASVMSVFLSGLYSCLPCPR